MHKTSDNKRHFIFDFSVLYAPVSFSWKFPMDTFIFLFVYIFIRSDYFDIQDRTTNLDSTNHITCVLVVFDTNSKIYKI